MNLDYLCLPPYLQEKLEEFLRPPPMEIQGQPGSEDEALRSGNGVWTQKRMFMVTEAGKNIQIGQTPDGDPDWEENTEPKDTVWVDNNVPTDMVRASRPTNFSHVCPVPCWHTPERILELLKFVDPAIVPELPDEVVLESPADVRFSEKVRERDGGIQSKVSTYPRGYCISLSQSGTRIALSFHPNLVEGDQMPAGGWNIPEKLLVHGGAFVIIPWEAVEDCPKERIAEGIYEHWKSCQETKQNTSYWNDFHDGQTDHAGGW